MPPFTTNMMKRLGIAPIADTLMKVPVREKGEGMPSTNVYHENAVHQADLLFLPHDKVGRKTYKYVLVGAGRPCRRPSVGQLATQPHYWATVLYRVQK